MKLILFLLSYSAIAAADEPPSPARDELRLYRTNAEAAVRAGNYYEAIAWYRKSWAVRANPAARFNMAQCYKAVGAYDLAKAELDVYLRFTPREKSSIDPDVQALVKFLREHPQAPRDPKKVRTVFDLGVEQHLAGKEAVARELLLVAAENGMRAETARWVTASYCADKDVKQAIESLPGIRDEVGYQFARYYCNSVGVVLPKTNPVWLGMATGAIREPRW